MQEIKIGGRTIPLLYSTYELIAIQKEIGCTAFQLNDDVFGVEKIDEDGEWELENLRFRVAIEPERTEKLGKLIRILGNAGLEENGENPDLTEKWILRRMKPSMILIYAVTVMSVINAGNSTEVKPEKNGEPVDEILEEEEGKKQQGN